MEASAKSIKSYNMRVIFHCVLSQAIVVIGSLSAEIFFTKLTDVYKSYFNFGTVAQAFHSLRAFASNSN